MKRLTNSFAAFSMVAVIFMSVAAVGCGKKGGKVKVSEKMTMLMAHPWKLDPNATIKGTTDAVEDTTGIKADIKLEGDVGEIANFLAETLVFGKDSKDKTKLSYSRTIGEGFLSSQVLGFWTMSDDESTIVMKEWDTQKGELPPVNYKIVELTADKLTLQKEGDATPNFYIAK